MRKKVVFMGTPEISVRVLEGLLTIKDAEVVGVVSQPDRAMNRKKEVVYNPVKTYCLTANLPIYQPEKIASIYDELKALAPDIIITCAYGQFIPQKILDLPPLGCFNLHASLLPKLRGGAPIHWSIINGDDVTGITLMEMILKMDAGNIVSQSVCSILPTDTASSLTLKLANLASDTLLANWDNLVTKNYHSIQQDEELATFGFNIKKEETYINFDQPIHLVDCFIRGLTNKPGAVWNYQGITIKVHAAECTNIKSSMQPGAITNFDQTGLYIATQDYDLKLIKIQLPNKNVVATKDIVNGHHPFRIGAR